MQKTRSLRLRIILYNSVIIFSTLVLIVGSVIAGMFFFINKSNQADMEFFVTQTVSNLAAKTQLMEDVLLSIRGNPVLMEYLVATEKFSEIEATNQLRRMANLYSDKNKSLNDDPCLTSVYLFDRHTLLTATHYNQFLQIQEELMRTQAASWFSQARKNNRDVEYIINKDSLVIVFTVYTDFMQDVGSVIFVIDIQAFKNILYSSTNYEDSFVSIYNKYKDVLLTSGNTEYSKESFNKFGSLFFPAPFSRSVMNTSCLLYNQQLNMGLGIIIGVPKNRIIAKMVDGVGIYIFSMMFGLAIIVVLSSISIIKLTGPLQEIANTMDKLDAEHYDIKLPSYDSAEFNNISRKFNEMTTRITYLIHDVFEKQLMLRESELKFLQAQMNPHFLFNVLNTIALKAKFDGSADILRMVTSFSKLAQASIYRSDKEKISISEELQLVDFYLYLQSCRFGDKFQYSIQITDPGIDKFFVPKLTVQLIAENGVLHGIEPKVGKGFIFICVSREGDTISIIVQDNGVGFDSDETEIHLPLPTGEQTSTHNRVGINNVNELLKSFYGEKFGLKITSKRNVGTTVEIKIPVDEG